MLSLTMGTIPSDRFPPQVTDHPPRQAAYAMSPDETFENAAREQP